MKNWLFTVLIVLIAAGGYLMGARMSAEPVRQASASPLNVAYVCPMHPNIVRDHPGTCPICGMELVATSDPSGNASPIHVDTATQQKLGVRLATATHATLTHDIHTYGTVVPEEGAVLRVTPNVDGVVQQLHVHTGQRVTMGQMLYELSSADALALQYEYVDLLRRFGPALKSAEDRREQTRKALAEAQEQGATAREQAERAARQTEEQSEAMLQPMRRDRERITLRLHQIGFTEEMIERLARTQKALAILPARAQQPCVVGEVMARPGMLVTSMTPLLACVQTSRAWLEIALYPDQLQWVRDGDGVTIEPEDGEPVSTRFTGLDALVDPSTRTVRARVPIATDRVGRIGDYVSVTIHASPRDVLAVPKTALIRSGHGNFVILAKGADHFMPVKVQTGIETDDRIGIRNGLAAGDQVVMNGQFLLDAAASLADTVQRMKEARAGGE